MGSTDKCPLHHIRPPTRKDERTAAHGTKPLRHAKEAGWRGQRERARGTGCRSAAAPKGLDPAWEARGPVRKRMGGGNGRVTSCPRLKPTRMVLRDSYRGMKNRSGRRSRTATTNPGPARLPNGCPGFHLPCPTSSVGTNSSMLRWGLSCAAHARGARLAGCRLLLGATTSWRPRGTRRGADPPAAPTRCRRRGGRCPSRPSRGRRAARRRPTGRRSRT